MLAVHSEEDVTIDCESVIQSAHSVPRSLGSNPTKVRPFAIISVVRYCLMDAVRSV